MPQKNSVWLKVSVPMKLKEDFKLACWLESATQSDKMLELMHGFVIANQKQIEEARSIKTS